MSKNKVSNTVQGVKKEIKDLKQWGKDTKAELKEVRELRELNNKAEEILGKMETQIKRDLQDIDKASGHLENALHGMEYDKYDDDYINKHFSKAKSFADDAAQCEGNIEGLTEQLEDVVQGEINDVKELEQFEERANEVSSEAKALSMKIDKIRDNKGY